MKLKFFLLMIVSLSGYACALDCSLPCGAKELVECAAKNNDTTPEDFFNYKLFHQMNIDGFCKNPARSNLKTVQQKYFFDKFCQSKKGSYLNYDSFIAAAKSFPTFGCSGDADNRYKELAGFLSTISEETTSRLNNYTNDGLYFRYENSALKGNSLNHKTSYFPSNGYMVAVNDDGEVSSSSIWFGKPSGATIMDLKATPETLIWGKVDVPDGYRLINLNKVIAPSYWVGMGPIQLTGGSIIEFFGWYNNNILKDSVQSYNISKFIEQYMQDGQMAFTGAFWYWMVRVGGIGYPTIHEIVTNQDKPVCHDIGVATIIINGGCRGYNPGRLNYYKYFTNLFHVDIKPVSIPIQKKGKMITLNSMECGEQLKRYCQQ